MQADEARYRVVESEQRTATILELWLRPLAAPLRYRPGEYVLLEDSGRGIAPRSYSIANAPRADGLISLLVTRVPGGLTRSWIHEHLRVGDDVSVSGPYGCFVDATASNRPDLYGRIPTVLPSVCGELVHHEAFIAGAPGFVIVRGCRRGGRPSPRARPHRALLRRPRPVTGRSGRRGQRAEP